MSESRIVTTAQTVTELRLPDLIQEKEVVVSVASFGTTVEILLIEAHSGRGAWKTDLTTQISILIPA
jgi:hypothetical protein